MGKKFAFLLLVFIGLQGCKKSPEEVTMDPYAQDNAILAEYLQLPSSPFDYASISVPEHLNTTWIYQMDNSPVDNPITNEGARLGRVLFYDSNLSVNNKIACASCHIQQFGFSDTAVLSTGHDGGKTGRHSMGLANARFRNNGKFFWDERSPTLEHQVLQPIQDEIEMGMDLTDLELKLSQLPYYPILFKRAFGSEEITSDKISKALAQFVRSMMSFNSKYDKGRKNHEINEPFSNFTPDENAGKALFHDLNKGRCFSCHFTEAFITDIARNNGLTPEKGADTGAELHTGNPLDKYAFKAPSLRNIGVRPPYMHGGQYPNLRLVVQTYSNGISWSPSLDPHLMAPGGQAAVRFNLTSEEIDQMVAFLHTLTDEEFLSDEKYSSPFK
jgi:cytochrome c peroxidase